MSKQKKTMATVKQVQKEATKFRKAFKQLKTELTQISFENPSDLLGFPFFSPQKWYTLAYAIFDLIQTSSTNVNSPDVEAKINFLKEYFHSIEVNGTDIFELRWIAERTPDLAGPIYMCKIHNWLKTDDLLFESDHIQSLLNAYGVEYLVNPEVFVQYVRIHKKITCAFQRV